MHKGSLYQTFGDKHSLFIQALKRYLEDMRRKKNELLKEAPTPFDGIRNVMHGMVDIANSDSECPMGCLAINSLVELAPHDAEVRAVMADHSKRMRESLEATVSDAQKAGQIDKRRSPQLIAAMLTTFMAGLGTTMRGQLSKAEAHELFEAQLEALT